MSDIAAWLGNEGICGWLIEINNTLKGLNENIKDLAINIKALAINSQLRAEALDPDLEYDRKKPPFDLIKVDNTRVEETFEITQDFTGVTIMLETEKAFLVVKNGYQMWVAKSNLKDTFYDLGTVIDLSLTEKAQKWLPKKSWEEYKPVKKGG